MAGKAFVKDAAYFAVAGVGWTGRLPATTTPCVSGMTMGSYRSGVVETNRRETAWCAA
jgi:hypothetical protein